MSKRIDRFAMWRVANALLLTLAISEEIRLVVCSCSFSPGGVIISFGGRVMQNPLTSPAYKSEGFDDQR